MPAASERGRLPLPAPPRARLVVPALAAGVVGTGLLYSGATGGGLAEILWGMPLFAFGLAAAGWPFVLSTALLSERRHGPRRRVEGG